MISQKRHLGHQSSRTTGKDLFFQMH